MREVPFISVRQLLGSPLSPLGRLVAAGRHQDAANAALQEFLEEPLKGRVCVARASSENPGGGFPRLVSPRPLPDPSDSRPSPQPSRKPTAQEGANRDPSDGIPP
jgi:hypothetical protein